MGSFRQCRGKMQSITRALQNFAESQGETGVAIGYAIRVRSELYPDREFRHNRYSGLVMSYERRSLRWGLRCK